MSSRTQFLLVSIPVGLTPPLPTQPIHAQCRPANSSQEGQAHRTTRASALQSWEAEIDLKVLSRELQIPDPGFDRQWHLVSWAGIKLFWWSVLTRIAFIYSFTYPFVYLSIFYSFSFNRKINNGRVTLMLPAYGSKVWALRFLISSLFFIKWPYMFSSRRPYNYMMQELQVRDHRRHRRWWAGQSPWRSQRCIVSTSEKRDPCGYFWGARQRRSDSDFLQFTLWIKYAAGSYDFDDHTETPRLRLSDDKHGTRYAGEIAARQYNMYNISVAYEPQVSGW